MKRTTHEIEGGRKLYLYSFGADPAAERQRKFWNAVGGSWKSESDVVEEWMEPITNAINARLGDHPRIAIDVGCGSGSMRLPPRWRVFGIDPAGEMLRQGRSVQGDSAQLPFQDAMFDAIVSRLALMLAPDPLAVFKELRRVLRMGGTLTFAVWAEQGANSWATSVEDVLRQELNIRRPDATEPHAFRLASKTEVELLLKASGLNPLSCEQVCVPYFERQTAEAAFEKILRLVGPVRTMFDKVREERKEEVRGKAIDGLNKVKRDGLVWVHHAERPVKFE